MTQSILTYIKKNQKSFKKILKKTFRSFKKDGWNVGIVITTLHHMFVVLGSQTAYADEATHPTSSEKHSTHLQVQAMENVHAAFGDLPESDDREAPKSFRVVATAYNSEVGQTDSTPFITASGTTVRHGVIAANFLPIGTKVKIPAYYGDQVFVVEDRMNPRYYQRLDIWMESKAEAKQFGVRTVEIEIYQ